MGREALDGTLDGALDGTLDGTWRVLSHVVGGRSAEGSIGTQCCLAHEGLAGTRMVRWDMKRSMGRGQSNKVWSV